MPMPSLSACLFPGSISDRVAKAYDRHLFGGATLQDLPNAPRFVINATNVQSGALWRFEKPYMRDYRVGEVKAPTIPLARAVAASSAFPPVLSPLRASARDERLHARLWHGPPARAVHYPRAPHRRRRLRQSRPRDRMEALSDRLRQRRRRQVSSPRRSRKSDWARHAYRVLDLDRQPGALVTQAAGDRFVQGRRRAKAPIGVSAPTSRTTSFADALPCPFERTLALAETPTRLKRLDDVCRSG